MGGMVNPRRAHTLIDSALNVIEDTLKHSLVTTDIDHWLIHKGLTWIYSVKATVAGLATKRFMIVNSAAGDLHIKEFSFSSKLADADLNIYRDPTTTANGTGRTWRNKNINFQASVPQSALYEDPTVTGLGTFLEYFQITGTKQTGGSAQGGGDEWVLPANGVFLFDYANISAQPDTVGVTIKTLDVGAF